MNATIRYKNNNGYKVTIVKTMSTMQLLYLALQNVLYQQDLRGTRTSILISFNPKLDILPRLGNTTSLISWIDNKKEEEGSIKKKT